MLILAAYAMSAASAAPIEITWQTRVLDADGIPHNGTPTIVFTLYDAAEDPSNELWSDSFPVDLQSGFGVVSLGSGTVPLTTTMLSGGDTWLETEVTGTITGPRQRLTHVPRAVIAEGVPVTASPSNATCTGQAGRLTFDSDAGSLKVCDGTAWRFVSTVPITLTNGARAYADGTFATSCDAYLNPTSSGYVYAGATGDGAYWIDPDGPAGNNELKTTCDMTTDGGGWTMLATFATITYDVVAATYSSGVGTYGNGDFAIPCAQLAGLGARPKMRIRMGNETDFFEPISTSNLCGMMTSFSKHRWADNPAGPFVTPPYYSSHLGGCASNWPANNVAGDDRTYIPFWGGGGAQAGCCHSTPGDTPTWERTFDVYVRE